MKKVIAVLPDNEYCLTTEETVAKHHDWYLAYRVEVVKEEKVQPDYRDAHKLPKVGTVMSGIGGHVYRISKIEATHVCAQCDRRGSENRIGKKFYCTPHFKKLTVTKPIVSTGNIPGRNEACHCGSGKKYKHCCLVNDRHEPRHYFNSQYKQDEIQQKKKSA